MSSHQCSNKMMLNKMTLLEGLLDRMSSTDGQKPQPLRAEATPCPRQGSRFACPPQETKGRSALDTPSHRQRRGTQGNGYRLPRKTENDLKGLFGLSDQTKFSNGEDRKLFFLLITTGHLLGRKVCCRQNVQIAFSLLGVAAWVKRGKAGRRRLWSGGKMNKRQGNWKEQSKFGDE